MITFNPRMDVPNLIPMQSNTPKSKEAQIKEAILKVLSFKKHGPEEAQSKEAIIVTDFTKNFSETDIAIMKNLLKDDNWMVRSYALHLYKGIKFHGKDNSALTPMVEAMQTDDRNAEVRKAAVYAIESSK